MELLPQRLTLLGGELTPTLFESLTLFRRQFTKPLELIARTHLLLRRQRAKLAPPLAHLRTLLRAELPPAVESPTCVLAVLGGQGEPASTATRQGDLPFGWQLTPAFFERVQQRLL